MINVLAKIFAKRRTSESVFSTFASPEYLLFIILTRGGAVGGRGGFAELLMRKLNSAPQQRKRKEDGDQVLTTSTS